MIHRGDRLKYCIVTVQSSRPNGETEDQWSVVHHDCFFPQLFAMISPPLSSGNAGGWLEISGLLAQQCAT